jgi:sugar/nucleoside kinase (ribokinase family)
VVAVTAGSAGGELLLPDGQELAIGGPRVSDPADDLGAGDVFAAAMFAELHGGVPAARAAAFAAAAAAVRLDGKGPGAIGDRAAIEQRLASG